MGKLLRRRNGRGKSGDMNWEDFVDEDSQNIGSSAQTDELEPDEYYPEEIEYYDEDADEYSAEEEEPEKAYEGTTKDFLAGADISGEEYEEEPENYFVDQVDPEEVYEDNPEEVYEDDPEVVYEDDPEVDYEEPYIYYAEDAEQEDYEGNFTEDYVEESEYNTEEPEEEDKKNIFALFWMRLVHMETMDKVITFGGIMILIIALVMGGIYMDMRTAADQMAEFVSVGSSLADVTLPGQAGLLAVADMEASKKAAAEALEEEQRRQEEEARQQEQTEYNEEEYVNVIDVTMKLTSIEKDLKIKFVNKKSGKLISNVPFSVEVKDAAGKSVSWTDEDLDGIIYQVNLEPGAYSVAVQKLSDSKYKDYKLPSSAQTVEVKKEIVYEKVDVTDEVKDETEVDVSKEETKPHEEEVPEETIKDTVEWVESTQSPVGYEKIDKSTITDPSEVTVAGNIQWMSSAPGMLTTTDAPAVKLNKEELILGVNESYSLQVESPQASGGNWISEKPGVATVDESGRVTAVSEGETAIVYTAADSVSGNNSNTAEGRCKVIVVSRQLQLSKSEATAYVGIPLVVNVTMNNGDPSAVRTVDSSDKAVADAALSENGDALTINGLKLGSAVITVRFQINGVEYSATCTVTVKDDPKTDQTTNLVDQQKRQVYVLENNVYRAAVYADYYTFDTFYIEGEVKYTGWQTLEGKVYYYDKDGVRVTGEQIIKGAKYNFDSEGALITDSGILGIDVSKWNGKIDWNAVKNSGISYVIIRCGYRGYGSGVLVEDPTYKTNIQGAIQAGLKVGVYFFTQAVSAGEAVEEASMVLEQVKNYKISYPIFLDVEHSGGASGRGDKISKETRTEVCRAFCQTIQNAGYTAGIYANKTWLTTMIDTPSLSAYKIWLAQYASAPTYTGRYDMWQYQSKGRVSGINGDVDMNWSYMGY